MIKETLANIRQRVSKTFEGQTEEMDIPSDKTSKDERVEFVKGLYNDSIKWRKKSLDNRFKSYNDPVELWRDARKLVNGQHWDVWGHRDEANKQTWKHEITRPIIEQQLGVRKTYLTSNVHDVTIFPNVANLNEITRQERDNTGWGKFVTEMVGRALTDGTAIGKEVVDRSEYDDGMSKSVVCDVESILPTPYATSLESTDGNWYLVDATMQNIHQIKQDFPDFDESKVSPITKTEIEEISGKEDFESFENTKLVLVLTCYLDDYRKEAIPFPKEEFDRRTALIHEGQDVPVLDDDNHESYINGYLDWLENTVIPNTGIEAEDETFVQQISEYVENLIAEHAQKLKDNPSKKRPKYPFGRRIVIAGKELLEDKPNPLITPWRKCYYKLDAEIVPGSFWGRGLPEQLWHINETLDIFLSRIGDLTLLTLPEKWMSIDDIEALKAKKIEYTNDPTEVKAYVHHQPVSFQGQMPHGFAEMVGQMLQAAESRGSQSDVVAGQSPGSHASGDLVQLLLQQSQNMITGETARNLTDLVANIMETKIEFYRNVYTEDRLWIINGRQEVLNLSEVLKKYPKFQVRVKPNSSAPNQWESDLAFALQLMKTPSADGSPLVATEFIYDLLGQRYPELAPGGKYYQLSEATKIGMQVINQEKAKQQENAQTLGQAGAMLKSRGLSAVMNQEPIGETPDGTQE